MVQALGGLLFVLAFGLRLLGFFGVYDVRVGVGFI